jgi:carbon-monoxide dehydrogenase medium subunit
MSLLNIKLHEPPSLADALKLLRELDEARVLAGGTDLLVEIKEGSTEAKHLISLQKIEELRGINKQNGHILIGALVTPKELALHSLIQKYLPALREAARSMASFQIRSMATIGGNIVSAVPSADLPPSLIAADASVTLVCSEDTRKVTLLEFFRGPRLSVCRGEEILTEIVIPVPKDNTGISYQKVMLRKANALAVASVAAKITLKNGKINKASLVLGAVGPTPLLALRASKYLLGKAPSDSLFKEAAAAAKDESLPISDIRGSLWYRKQILEVLTQRALKEAFARAQEGMDKKTEKP